MKFEVGQVERLSNKQKIVNVSVIDPRDSSLALIEQLEDAISWTDVDHPVIAECPARRRCVFAHDRLSSGAAAPVHGCRHVVRNRRPKPTDSTKIDVLSQVDLPAIRLQITCGRRRTKIPVVVPDPVMTNGDVVPFSSLSPARQINPAAASHPIAAIKPVDHCRESISISTTHHGSIRLSWMSLYRGDRSLLTSLLLDENDDTVIGMDGMIELKESVGGVQSEATDWFNLSNDGCELYRKAGVQKHAIFGRAAAQHALFTQELAQVSTCAPCIVLDH